MIINDDTIIVITYVSEKGEILGKKKSRNRHLECSCKPTKLRLNMKAAEEHHKSFIPLPTAVYSDERLHRERWWWCRWWWWWWRFWLGRGRLLKPRKPRQRRLLVSTFLNMLSRTIVSIIKRAKRLGALAGLEYPRKV